MEQREKCFEKRKRKKKIKKRIGSEPAVKKEEEADERTSVQERGGKIVGEQEKEQAEKKRIEKNQGKRKQEIESNKKRYLFDNKA